MTSDASFYRCVGPALSTHASRTPLAAVSQGTLASWFLLPGVVAVIQSTSPYRIPPCTQRPSSMRHTPSNKSLRYGSDGMLSTCHIYSVSGRRSQCPSELYFRTNRCCYSSSGMISDVSPVRYGISSSSLIPSCLVGRGECNAASRFAMLIRIAMQVRVRHSQCG